MKHMYDIPTPVSEVFIGFDTAEGLNEVEADDFEFVSPPPRRLPPRLEVSMTLTQTPPVGQPFIDVLRKSAERPVLAADEKALRNTTSMTPGAWKPWSDGGIEIKPIWNPWRMR